MLDPVHIHKCLGMDVNNDQVVHTSPMPIWILYHIRVGHGQGCSGAAAGYFFTE